MRNLETPIKLKTHYRDNDKFELVTRMDRINLDKKREEDIKNGTGFIISKPQGIKKDIKSQDGIFSSMYGGSLKDVDSYMGPYKCDYGCTRGSLYHGTYCPICGTMVKYVGDDIKKFGWMVLKEPYYVIHPNMYMSLQAFIGQTRLLNIITPQIDVDKNGKEIPHKSKKRDEPFEGIGIPGLQERFDEIMNCYLQKYPQKISYYEDIMKYRDIIFTRSIPVYSTFLRPSKEDNTSLKYEKTNENYNMINTAVYRCNDNKLYFKRKKKKIYNLLFDIQSEWNDVYAELKNVLSKKKGDIRSSIGGRYSFSAHLVIVQGPDLKADQVRLSYHALCGLLEQVIINILTKSYTISYADAYKKWYRSQITFDQIVYDIIDGLIKDSNGGLPVMINRNPTIQYGSILFVRCVGINMNYTMSVSLSVLPKMAADFDGDAENVLYLFNKDFIAAGEKSMSPRVMHISRNDGRCDPDLLPARDIIINANGLKGITTYTDEEIEKIRRLQEID